MGSIVIKKLVLVSIIALTLMTVEIVGGYLAHSLAIMTDAAHMFSDFLGFFISISSVIIAKKAANHSHTYGYHRAEVIGAMGSVIIIWGITLWLVYEALHRIIVRDFILHPDFMLGTSIFALLSNLIMMYVLHGQPGFEHHESY